LFRFRGPRYSVPVPGAGAFTPAEIRERNRQQLDEAIAIADKGRAREAEKLARETAEHASKGDAARRARDAGEGWPSP